MVLPRLVIDTNILIAALRSRRGASAKLLSLIGTGQFEVHLSPALALEYETLLTRQRHELGLTADDISDVVDSLCALAVRHGAIYFRWRPYLPDANDDFLLELAVLAQCHYIITFNQKDFIGIEQFGLQAIGPKQFLQEIGAIP